MAESRSSKRAKKNSAEYWRRQINYLWTESAAIRPVFDKDTNLPTGDYKENN